jgi:SAM-dependent methyltransferase
VDIAKEVERIRERYGHYDRDAQTRARWSAFSEEEVAHRNQQYGALAALFRRIGRSTLADLKVLDVGCGSGRMVRACLDLGAAPGDVIGVDLQTNRIEEARRLSPHLDFRVSNGTDLDFPDEAFDLVMQFVVFSSIFAENLRQRLASEMVRVLKPGGYIFWWDCIKTVQGQGAQALVPQELFPGMSAVSLPFALWPRPSQCIARRRLSRWLAPFVDRLGYPLSHTAALLGPKGDASQNAVSG